MIHITDTIYFTDGRVYHDLHSTAADQALIDSLEEIVNRPPMSEAEAFFTVQCILNGEYIPLIYGAELGCWNGKGYYGHNRYKKWYVWQSDGIIGPGFYEGTYQLDQSSKDGYLRERSTIASKFLTK